MIYLYDYELSPDAYKARLLLRLAPRQAAGFDRPADVVHFLICPDVDGGHVDLDLLAVEPATAEGHRTHVHLERAFDNPRPHL